MGDFTQKTQFDYLYDALAQKYPGIKNADGKDTLFQFVSTPIQAAWTKSDLAEAYDFANSVPANLDGFYVSGGGHIDAACKDLYRAIKPNANIDIAQYKKYSTEYDALNNQLADMNAEADSAYKVWAAENQDAHGIVAGKEAWYQDPHGGLTWANKEQKVQQSIDDMYRAMKELTDAAQSPVKDAMDAFNNDTMLISYPHGKAFAVPRVTIDGDLSSDIVRWQSIPANQYEFDVRINANRTITSPWQTTYETKVTQQCFKTSVDVKVDTSRIITDTHYELRYTAVGINSYPITRGNWFDTSFVRTDVPLIEGIGVSGDTFFGRNGSLHLIPVNILVIYKPTITLTISAERYKEQFGAYADTRIDWLDIFGFRFQVGANKKLEPVTNPDGTVSVTFTCPDNPVPQIVGVTSLLRYNSK